MRIRERRHVSENAALNIAVVRVVGGVALMLSAGSVVLAWQGTETPEWFGNALLTIMGGLIGYLAKDIKQQLHPTVDAPNAGTVNVDTGGMVSADDPALGNATPAPTSTPGPGLGEDRR
jgi:hypothetical protein